MGVELVWESHQYKLFRFCELLLLLRDRLLVLLGGRHQPGLFLLFKLLDLLLGLLLDLLLDLVLGLLLGLLLDLDLRLDLLLDLLLVLLLDLLLDCLFFTACLLTLEYALVEYCG